MRSDRALDLPPLQPSVRDALDRYCELLLQCNASLNLTAARSPAEVAEHVSDSLRILPYVAFPLVDVGSGGGFPGIALAIASGGAVTLIEAAAKKARFLESVIGMLGLEVTVVIARAEDAARRADLREHFAAATARGVAGLSTVLELTVPFLAVGGIAVLQRGRLLPQERETAADAALVLGAEIVGERATGETPEDQRRVLLVRKSAPTPARFPRRVGMPAKRPLCGA
ncbi:MAG: 16S rRNA (guanine(527)-N(7))-methyltransferase RsmG [Candidatus Eremiobacteraeota bacterium]|nr:16S rRNA (guanine(527)-N(7))-methyltransferase RsmG [Candidatus Eremiobacteraeota bacterium]